MKKQQRHRFLLLFGAHTQLRNVQTLGRLTEPCSGICSCVSNEADNAFMGSVGG